MQQKADGEGQRVPGEEHMDADFAGHVQGHMRQVSAGAEWEGVSVKPKKHNIIVVITVRAKKKHAKQRIIALMNNATVSLDLQNEFPEWGFLDEYAGEKVKK